MLKNTVFFFFVFLSILILFTNTGYDLAVSMIGLGLSKIFALVSTI